MIGIEEVIDPNDYDCGVVVARFQIDELHKQHRNFMDFVIQHHRKVIVFLGQSRTPSTTRNPLDFTTRKLMVQKHYPTVNILPLVDNRSNSAWVKQLDSEVKKVFPNSKPILYGGKDSFIPYYVKGGGKFDSIELISGDVETNGTAIREQISRDVYESSKFRQGVIYSTYNRPPITFPTVDICSHDGEGNILLAKKPTEDKYRFVGGFVDTSDLDYERAAKREYREETQGEVNSLKYVLSQKVDDWRYRKERDGIMTTLFLGYHFMGASIASDDIAEVKWFPASIFTNPKKIKRLIMPEHQEMMGKLIQKIYEENLIPNLGDFYVKPEKRIDPDVAQPSKYQITL